MTDKLYERSAEAKRGYIDGMRAGVTLAAGLAAIYEGQSDIKGRIQRAGEGMVDVMEKTLEGDQVE